MSLLYAQVRPLVGDDLFRLLFMSLTIIIDKVPFVVIVRRE